MKQRDVDELRYLWQQDMDQMKREIVVEMQRHVRVEIEHERNRQNERERLANLQKQRNLEPIEYPEPPPRLPEPENLGTIESRK